MPAIHLRHRRPPRLRLRVKCPASALDLETAEKVYPHVTFHGDEVEIPDDIWEAIQAQQSTPLLSRAMSAAEAAFRWTLAGFPVVDEKTHLDRSVQCSICPRWDARAGRCLECGCYALKLRLTTERCPLARW